MNVKLVYLQTTSPDFFQGYSGLSFNVSAYPHQTYGMLRSDINDGLRSCEFGQWQALKNVPSIEKLIQDTVEALKPENITELYDSLASDEITFIHSLYLQDDCEGDEVDYEIYHYFGIEVTEDETEEKITYGTDWNNIDLNDGCQRDLHLIDGLTFETLLLEINCNLPVINRDTVRKQFLEDLESRITEAKSVFESNLDNIVNYAIAYRSQD